MSQYSVRAYGSAGRTTFTQPGATIHSKLVISSYFQRSEWFLKNMHVLRLGVTDRVYSRQTQGIWTTDPTNHPPECLESPLEVL